LPSAQTPIDARHRHVSSLQQQPLRSLAQPTEKTAPQNHHRFFHRDERRTSSLCYPLPSCPPAKLSNLFVNWPWILPVSVRKGSTFRINCVQLGLHTEAEVAFDSNRFRQRAASDSGSHE